MSVRSTDFPDDGTHNPFGGGPGAAPGRKSPSDPFDGSTTDKNDPFPSDAGEEVEENGENTTGTEDA